MKTNLIQKIKNVKKDLPNFYFWFLVIFLIVFTVYIDFIPIGFLNKFFNLFKNIDANLIAIILAVAGWLIAIFLQNMNIKQQLKTEIKYDIYKQLVVLHKENQDLLANLMAKTTPPFILMESSMISFNLSLKKEYKGQWIPYGEMECVFEGETKWNSFITDLNETYFDFSDRYVSMFYILEDWMAPIKNLRTVKEVLAREISSNKDQIYKNINQLQMYSVKNGNDWRKWDRKEIEKIADSIQNDAQEISMYMHDFMVLIHNELLSGYFKYKRPTRKTFDEKYRVLTKSGIILNLETDPEKIKEFNKIISEINEN